jgi:putative ABC transport system permease protein
MIPLLRYFSLRHLLAHKTRTLLSLFAVSLGVALFVSSDATNSSVETSFRNTLRELGGKAQWQVTRGRQLGVEESAIERIRPLPGAVAAPIIQASVTLPDLQEGSLLVLGIDFWKDSPLRLYSFEGAADPGVFAAAAFVPGAIVLTKRFADRNGLKVGSRLKVVARQGFAELRVTGLMSDAGPARALGGNLAVMEIHSAQKLFGRPGFVDRIEVAGVDRETLQAAVGPEYRIEPVVHTSSTMEDALARIRSLWVVSLIALLVGMLIIYQTVSISVLERVRDVAILRSLGATRRALLVSLLLEWSLIGLAGSALGVGLGYLLARGLVEYTAGTINAMIRLVDVGIVALTPVGVCGGLVAGTLAAAAAAVVPARRAAALPLVESLRKGIFGYRHSRGYLHLLAAGVAMIAIGSALVAVSPESLPPYSGLLASVLVFVGMTLAMPQICIAFSRVGRPALRRIFRVEGFLATDNAAKFPQRTGLTVVSLGGALAMMVSTATLVEGFHVGTTRWMDHSFPFDLTVSATDFSSAIYNQSTIPESTLREALKVEGVEMAYGMHKAFSDYRGQEIMIIAMDTGDYLKMRDRVGARPLTPKLAQGGGIEKLLSGTGVVVSENMAARFGLRPGDRLELSTPSGVRSFEVLDSIEDYSWPRGVAFIDRETYRKEWSDPELTYVDVLVRRGADRRRVKADLARAMAGKTAVFVYDVAELKAVADETMKQTVQVANMQVIVALLIGFLGILNTLLISVLRRTREIGLLRALGMTRRQVARTVVIEAVLVALAGGALGVAGGLFGAAYPLRLHTLQITGYLAPFAVPWASVGLALSTAIAIGFLASLIPARRASKFEIVEAVACE